VLAQRAASEGPRWTRAVETKQAPSQERKMSKLGGTYFMGGLVDVHALGREGEPPDHPSCSQSPHDETVVARCAQWRTVRRLPCGGDRWLRVCGI